MSTSSIDLKSLQWRLRRGMLELDVMLRRFVVAQLDSMGDLELGCLDRLLDVEDDVLWSWLSGRDAPQQEDLVKLVERIRTSR